MDRPQVDRIEGVPPAIAIDQTNPVRTSRSTVGTNDRAERPPEAALRALPARSSAAAAAGGWRATRRQHLRDACRTMCGGGRSARRADLPVHVPASFGEDEVRAHLEAAGLHAGLRPATVRRRPRRRPAGQGICEAVAAQAQGRARCSADKGPNSSST